MERDDAARRDGSDADDDDNGWHSFQTPKVSNKFFLLLPFAFPFKHGALRFSLIYRDARGN